MDQPEPVIPELLGILEEVLDAPEAFAENEAFNRMESSSGPEGTPVILVVSGLGGAPHVVFNGVESPARVLDPHRITTTVPAGAATGPITVSSGGHRTSTPIPFTVLPTPGLSITSFSPLVGKGAPSSLWTASGSPWPPRLW
jgi:hypothetical protein